MRGLKMNADYIHDQLDASGQFEMLSDDHSLPLVAWSCKPDDPYTAFDLEDKVREQADAKAHVDRSTFVNGEIDRLDESIEEVATELTEFTSDQRTENDATRARTNRTEVMVEQLLRQRGRRPPKKSEPRRALDRSVGIDPDHPLK